MTPDPQSPTLDSYIEILDPKSTLRLQSPPPPPKSDPRPSKRYTQNSKLLLPHPHIRVSAPQRGSFRPQNPRPSDSKTSSTHTQPAGNPGPQTCSRASSLSADPQAQAPPPTLTQLCQAAPPHPPPARGGRRPNTPQPSPPQYPSASITRLRTCKMA